MARTALPERPDTDIPSAIAIVASLYNRKYVDAMVDAARQEIKAMDEDAQVPVFRVPGAFEIPVTVEKLCREADFDAIIALGVIIRGETAHADLIGTAVTQGLQDSAIRHVTPVIHEVLLVEDTAQAEERCLGSEINRGVEAARVAAGMADLFHQIEDAFSDSDS